MALRKKSTVQELKELIEATPITNVLSVEQLDSLKKILSDLSDISYTLRHLRDESELSSAMFDVGGVSTIVDQCEKRLDNIVDSFREKEEDENDY